MISRSTLIGALVVVELAIVGAAARSLTCDLGPRPASAFGPGTGHFGGAANAGTFGPAAGRARLDRSFATGPAPHVVVDVKDARVVIQAAAGSVVRVAEHVKTFGWVSGGVPPVQAERTADGVRIVSREGGVHVVMGGIEHVVLVTVPPGAAVEVGSDARIDASGLRARFTAHTGDGSVHVSDQRGDLDVSTGDGRIELVDVQATEVTARTGDGRLLLRRVVADRLRADTGDGRIDATDVRLGEGAIATKDGRVNVAYTPDSDATLTVRTAEGRVEVAGGLTTSTTTDDEDGHQRVVRLGSGRGRFEISSGSGSISLTQGAQV